MAKKRINSRAKGCRAEREAVKLLRKVFKDDAFRRRGSGFEDFDIIVPDWFPFVVEVKDRKDMTYKRLLTCKQPMYSFIEQAVRQAKAAGKPPWSALVLVKIEGQWWAVYSSDSMMASFDPRAFYIDSVWLAIPAEAMSYAKETA